MSHDVDVRIVCVLVYFFLLLFLLLALPLHNLWFFLLHWLCFIFLSFSFSLPFRLSLRYQFQCFSHCFTSNNDVNETWRKREKKKQTTLVLLYALHWTVDYASTYWQTTRISFEQPFNKRKELFAIQFDSMDEWLWTFFLSISSLQFKFVQNFQSWCYKWKSRERDRESVL